MWPRGESQSSKALPVVVEVKGGLVVRTIKSENGESYPVVLGLVVLQSLSYWCPDPETLLCQVPFRRSEAFGRVGGGR